jgi:hypothetical protein
VKNLAKIITTLICSITFVSSNLGLECCAQEVKANPYWIDSSTGLMWAGKDNGKAVNLKQAIRYCRDLRLAGYSNWRLGTLAELEGIYNKSSIVAGLAGLESNPRPVTRHVKGNLLLTGNQWANNLSGRTSGYQYYFDFNEGKANNQPSGFPYSSSFMRALCVRDSSK